MKLHEITTEFKLLDQYLEANDGELTAEIEILQKELTLQIRSKVDNIASYKAHLDDSLEIITKRRKQVQDLEKSFKNKIERFKDYIYMCMKGADLKKIETPLSRVTISKARKSLVIDESKLDKKYFERVTTFIVNKDLVKEDLEKGNVAGAHYEEKEPVLIKRKG